MIAPLAIDCDASASLGRQAEVVDPRRHRLACRLLRNSGKANFESRQFSDHQDGLPLPRRGESLIDWLVRSRIAATPQDASAGLARAAGLDKVIDELLALDNTDF